MYGHAWQANYAAAKGGLMGLSHIVAIEGSAYGIKSNLLMPTADTRLGQEMTEGFVEIPEFVKSMQGADWSILEGRSGVEFNTPLVLYLASEHCQHSHGIFSANAGRYAQVHICAAEGWVSPPGQEPASPEDIASHFEQIRDLTHYHEPLTVYDEFNAVAAAKARQGVA
jgi:hypothetical protein